MSEINLKTPIDLDNLYPNDYTAIAELKNNQDEYLKGVDKLDQLSTLSSDLIFQQRNTRCIPNDYLSGENLPTKVRPSNVSRELVELFDLAIRMPRPTKTIYVYTYIADKTPNLLDSFLVCSLHPNDPEEKETRILIKNTYPCCLCVVEILPDTLCYIPNTTEIILFPGQLSEMSSDVLRFPSAMGIVPRLQKSLFNIVFLNHMKCRDPITVVEYYTYLIKQAKVEPLTFSKKFTSPFSNISKYPLNNLKKFINPWDDSFFSLLFPLNIKEIDEFKDKQYDYLMSLPDSVKSSLTKYTRHGDEFINGYLVGHSPDETRQLSSYVAEVPFDEKLIKRTIIDLNNAMLQAPKRNKPMYVYRGAKFGETNFSAGQYVDLFLDHYSSSTLSIDVAYDFARQPKHGCCFFVIEIPPDLPCLYLAPISEFPGEEEVLLPPGLMFQVSNEIIPDYVKYHGINIIHLKCVNSTAIRSHIVSLVNKQIAEPFMYAGLQLPDFKPTVIFTHQNKTIYTQIQERKRKIKQTAGASAGAGGCQAITKKTRLPCKLPISHKPGDNHRFCSRHQQGGS